MHSNKFRFESDLKCRAIYSSRDGEIKQFRFESDMQCALPFLKESLILGESNQINSDFNQTWSGEIKQFRFESDMQCGGPVIPKGIIDFGGIQSNKFRFESDLKCGSICPSREEVCTFQVWAKSDFVSKLIQIWITFQIWLKSEFQTILF